MKNVGKLLNAIYFMLDVIARFFTIFGLRLLLSMSKLERQEKQKLSYQGMFYGMQRIDLLTISISGAGVFVVMNTLKFLIEQKMDVSFILKLSGLVFIFSIILNFISQYFGYVSNKYDYLMYDSKKDSEDFIKYDSLSELNSKWTERFTWSSIFVMFAGLSLITYYFLCFF